MVYISLQYVQLWNVHLGNLFRYVLKHTTVNDHTGGYLCWNWSVLVSTVMNRVLARGKWASVIVLVLLDIKWGWRRPLVPPFSVGKMLRFCWYLWHSRDSLRILPLSLGLGLGWDSWMSEEVPVTIPGLEAHWKLDVVSQELEMEKSFQTF